MPIIKYNDVKPGLLVSIILKADQRTGKQVQGTVAQLLTHHNHPRGIKVKLTDGRVGRVQQIAPQKQTPTMSSGNNPWADSPSQGNPHASSNNPFQQQPQQQDRGSNDAYYGANSSQQHPQQHQQQSSYGNQPQQQGGYGHGGAPPPGPPPTQGIRRSETERLAAEERDLGAQYETMQAYEANATQSEDDKNQAELQRLFPKIDSSLIAAIYNERKPDMAEVRELLQELDSTS